MQVIIILGIILCTFTCIPEASSIKSLHSMRIQLQASNARVSPISTIRGGKTILPKAKAKSKENIFSLSYWSNRFKSFLDGFRGKKAASKSEEKGGKEKASADKKKAKASSSNQASSSNSGLARIQKELQEFMARPPSHCKVEVGSNIRQWVVTITGAEGTIYAGESYKLQFKFPKDYPSKPPVVYFLKPVPRHVHVYSNGDICLNLLGKGWAPGMTAESIAVSILSMLSSAKEKKIPPDNALHSDNAPGMQQDNWMYHDDRC
jgi:ubiquitin-conjugating enzyme E2 W